MFSEADVKDKGCTFPEALKTIEEKCHGQEACSMVTAPEIFGSGLPSYNGGDPCPGVSKVTRKVELWILTRQKPLASSRNVFFSFSFSSCLLPNLAFFCKPLPNLCL